jgi:hypothetical protein
MIKDVVLDLDDFNIFAPESYYLSRIKEHYPDFKVTLFHIPMKMDLEMSMRRIFRDDGLKWIKDNSDWIQLVPHGLTHLTEEFLHADRTTTQLALKAIDEAFTKDGLTYEKGFKAPFWQWNKDVVDILDERGWWGAIDMVDKNNYGFRPKRYYQYDYSISEPFWSSDKELVKLHGHVDGISPNDLEKCVLHILKLPADVKWHFATDYIDEQN